jgi:hypothetical protein
MASRSGIRRILALVSLSTVMVACTSEGPPPGPTARASDPQLTHSWTMPASAGPVAQVDLGTDPQSIADEMMEDGKIAGIVHRIATRCAERGELPRPGVVALRFAVADGGRLAAAEEDPRPQGGGCLARALEAENDALKSLPAGAALVRIQLYPPG